MMPPPVSVDRALKRVNAVCDEHFEKLLQVACPLFDNTVNGQPIKEEFHTIALKSRVQLKRCVAEIRREVSKQFSLEKFVCTKKCLGIKRRATEDVKPLFHALELLCLDVHRYSENVETTDSKCSVTVDVDGPLIYIIG